MNAKVIEWRAQRRASGWPVIASRPLDGSEGTENARRRAEFYRRLQGQAYTKIEIWGFGT